MAQAPSIPLASHPLATHPLAIHPLEWASLPELGDTPPLDASDLACMEELRATLARHGKLGRFAVHLAHRHFDLAPGEILIERPDGESRRQVVTVGRLADEPDARPTTWLFEAGRAFKLSDAVHCVCVSDPTKTNACARHGKTSSPSPLHQKEDATKKRRISEEMARHERGFPAGGHEERDR